MSRTIIKECISDSHEGAVKGAIEYTQDDFENKEGYRAVNIEVKAISVILGNRDRFGVQHYSAVAVVSLS